MRILLLTSTFPDRVVSYSASFISVLSEYLQQRGHQVVIVTQRRPDTPPDVRTDGIEIRRFEFSGWESNLRWSTQRSVPVGSTLSFLWNMFQAARSVIKEQEIDVIHCFWVIPSGFLGIFLKAFSGIPLVVTAPGSDLNVWVHRRFIRSFIAFTVRRADRLIVLGRQMRESALAVGGKAERIVSMLGNGGVDLTRFSPAPPEEKAAARAKLGLAPSAVVCLFIGRLERPKLIPLLVEAVALARVNEPSLKLLLVGGGEWDRSNIDTVSFEETVVSYGPQAPAQLRLYLAASDVFLYASTMEGIPLAIVEAMASGLPVVASAVGGIPDIVQDGVTGYTVENDPAVFAERISVLAMAEDKRLEMGRLGHSRAVETLSSRSILPQIERVYKEAVEQNRRLS